MADKENNAPEQPAAPVDLSSLQDLDFGPSWSSRDSKPTRAKSSKPAKGPRKDRRSFQGRPKGGERTKSYDKPTVRRDLEINFYPEDVPFQALTKAIKESCKTYELFEITQLILEKPERFVVLVAYKQKEGETAKKFYYTVADKAPFESEEEAINHVLKNQLERFFTIEETDAEPPKGNFSSINKCSVTGALLGPPNYHLYQQILQDHYATHISGMSFEQFSAKIVSEKEPESIQQWIESMSKRRVYTPKTETEESPAKLESLDAARHYIITKCKDKAIRAGDSVRFSGKQLAQMGSSSLKQSIEAALEEQKRFPLSTANNLRGRIRRMRFNIYKKGPVSYVSGVKRKFREEGTPLAEDVDKLITFLDQHPGIARSDAPLKYLGLEEVTEEVSQGRPFKDCVTHLRWLISEGYVTEYGDGKLHTTAILPKPKPKEEAPQEEKTETDKESEIKEEEATTEKASEETPSACDL